MFANPRTFLAGAVAAALLGVTGCASPPAAAPAASPVASPAVTFSATENAWIEINIAMDEQLLPLLDLVPTHGAEAGLKELSEQFKARTTEELDDLRRLHGEAGLPAENPHEGMPMPGMVTPEQVTEAARHTGPEFDRLVRTRLGAHLKQGHSLVGSLVAMTTTPQVREVADRVKLNRDFAISSLQEINKNQR